MIPLSYIYTLLALAFILRVPLTFILIYKVSWFHPRHNLLVFISLSPPPFYLPLVKYRIATLCLHINEDPMLCHLARFIPPIIHTSQFKCKKNNNKLVKSFQDYSLQSHYNCRVVESYKAVVISTLNQDYI